MKTSYRYLLPTVLTGCIVLAAQAQEAPSAMPAAAAASVDCSSAYGGQPARCERVPCGGLYSTFLGTWSGKFSAYEQKKSVGGKTVFRPYQNTISYAQADCLKNAANGDTFIVGHQTDDYPVFEDLPAKTDHGLLITGRKGDGTPFLRTVGKQGSYDYSLVYRNTAAKLAIWKLSIPASAGNPAMTFTTIDGRDESAGTETRDVTVTMSIGPADAPMFESVIAYGSHTKS
ncbi:MAG TPA: hypothetical protein VH327_08870 [Gammaproteobacteria bacterium]|jgi:hypothetical protein|nr:hypothetical protein [Gammaproteobacteria bacterium]